MTSSNVFNPFAEASADEVETLLRAMCAPGLSASDAAELDDQIEALVSAAIELRDLGFLNLNAKSLSDLSRLDGFMSLASDDRLTSLSRKRCVAIRDRMIIRGVQTLLGHTGD